LSGDLYYEEQKPEALRRAKYFREERIPKFLGWFEGILAVIMQRFDGYAALDGGFA